MSDRKLVVFDFDGTLVNSEPHFSKALEEFSGMKSLPYDTKKMMLGYVDPVNNDLGWGIELEDQPALFQEYCRYNETELIDKKRFMPEVFDDVLDVLNTLRIDYELALVTARDRATTLAALAHHDMAKFFPIYRTHCCARDRGYAIKPAPDALECLLREMNYDPKDIVMIGDTNSDIEMANAAGAKSIAVSWGLHPSDKLQASNPTLFVSNVKDLPAAIDQLFSL